MMTNTCCDLLGNESGVGGVEKTGITGAWITVIHQPGAVATA